MRVFQVLDDDEFFKILMREPQEVSIVEVGDFIPSDEIKNGFYFYVTYLLKSTSQEKKRFPTISKSIMMGKLSLVKVLNYILYYLIFQGLNMEILDVLKRILLKVYQRIYPSKLLHQGKRVKKHGGK